MSFELSSSSSKGRLTDGELFAIIILNLNTTEPRKLAVVLEQQLLLLTCIALLMQLINTDDDKVQE